MRAWLQHNGRAGVLEAAVIFAGVPAECARSARAAARRHFRNIYR